MTNEEQKLREIAYKHAEPKVIWNDGNMSIYPDEEKIESLISDLTALISEHYYPKEFVEWYIMGKHGFGRIDDKLLLMNVYEGSAKKYTIDDMFNWWKENVR